MAGGSSSATGTSTNAGSSAGTSSNINSGSDKSAFGSVAAAMNAADSTSSPIPNASNPNNQTGSLQGLNFATNAFAAQQAALPPGYAYFYGQVPNLQAAYGATAAGVYPGTPMAVPTAAGGTATTQFQKSAYGTRLVLHKPRKQVLKTFLWALNIRFIILKT